MRWLGYIWCFAYNIFYAVVVFGVLIGIKNPFEKAIIAVLGVIYVAIRGQGIGNGLAVMQIVTAFQDQVDKIRYAVDNTFELPDRSEELSASNYVRNKLYISGCFLFLISLICLWQFFDATQHG
jgi:uncharacterized phage-like protein YoqJ